ncbi:PoNe immunity protein domain-containing protein, partial [Prevotella jejuni]
ENPIYNDILNRVSLGVLLNIPDDNIKQLITYVQQMDEQAKPADWTPDLLLWFMLNSRMGEDKKQTHANKLAFPKLHKELFKLTQLSDAQAAKKALIDYIGKWYNLNKDAPWYNNHLKTSCYRGYWAWEVAAVAKILQIDDSDLKDNPYYPYDMVHWGENDTTNDE